MKTFDVGCCGQTLEVSAKNVSWNDDDQLIFSVDDKIVAIFNQWCWWIQRIKNENH
jgi:hypothetical protein